MWLYGYVAVWLCDYVAKWLCGKMVPLALNIPTPTPARDWGGPVACLGGPVASAFDKVDHEKLVEAMLRLGVPKNVIDVLTSFYVSP